MKRFILRIILLAIAASGLTGLTASPLFADATTANASDNTSDNASDNAATVAAESVSNLPDVDVNRNDPTQ